MTFFLKSRAGAGASHVACLWGCPLPGQEVGGGRPVSGGPVLGDCGSNWFPGHLGDLYFEHRGPEQCLAVPGGGAP